MSIITSLRYNPPPGFRPTPSHFDPEAQVFVIFGDPVPWSRAGKAKGGHMYDPQKVVKQHTHTSIEGQLPLNFKPYAGPLILDIRFYIQMPKRKRAWNHYEGGPHFCKPDNSNLQKFVEDVCTHLAFVDDSQIAVTLAKKYYSEFPRTEFSLIEIKENGRY